MAMSHSKAENQNGKNVMEKSNIKIEIIRKAMPLSYMVQEKKQN